MNSAKLYPRYDWNFGQEVAPDKISELASTINSSDMVAELLLSRGFGSADEVREFFRPKLDSLHDPFLLRDMEKAVNRLVDALSNEEEVMIYGDYDVDGTTAVSMCFSFLNALGFKIHRYIPDRYEEGYGVSKKGVQEAIEKNCSLMITLDCGIRDISSIAVAVENGLDVIVCDHHEPGEDLPDAHAVLNPKRKDCSYPFDGLSGCGVGFKLLHAFSIQNDLDERLVYSCLDFVALSIAADIVPVIDENRALLSFGLWAMNDSLRPPFSALFSTAKAQGGPIGVTDLVFTIAPRINAAGRMEHAMLAVELLTETIPERCLEKAAEIEALNKQRRDDDKDITTHALKIIEETESEHHATVVFAPEWNKGVIGIVASRLIESHYKPTIVLSGDNGILTGSARSIPGFNIHSGLEECSDLLEKFGGHEMAAGLTIKEEKLELFKERFSEQVKLKLNAENIRPELKVDVEMDLDEFRMADLNYLQRFEPCGPGNPQPIFISRSVEIAEDVRIIGKDKSHISLKLRNSNGSSIDCVGFGMADAKPFLKKGNKVDLVFTIQKNYWRGTTRLQLFLKDLAPVLENA